MANPIAKITFQTGEVVNIELYTEEAPLSVANFVKLATEGYYNGLCLHRIIKGFMIQGGGFIAEKGKLTPAKNLQPIKGEFIANGIMNNVKHVPGVISMARTNVMNSATSQFFLCAGDCAFLDGQYAGFGKTADKESLDAILKLSQVKTGRVGYYDDVPVDPVVIKDIIIIK
ncbi:MAG: peptidylprolyl isomerase [Christensenellaceae bacterium]|jgi:peptidyl-prolyl cis-trans isomerase B (cyclophilin B)|nr:peptidylprolyl isomerase [Christensenellaceae bacterium]